MDSDDGEVLPCGSLDDLVSDAHQRAPDVLAVEDDLVSHVVLPSWPRGTGLKVAAGEASRGGGGSDARDMVTRDGRHRRPRPAVQRPAHGTGTRARPGADAPSRPWSAARPPSAPGPSTGSSA